MPRCSSPVVWSGSNPVVLEAVCARPRDPANAAAIVSASRRVMVSDLEFAGAVAERVLLNSKLVQHRQQKIGHGSVRRKRQVTTALQLTGSAAGQHYGQGIVIVLIPVTHAAAVKDH